MHNREKNIEMIKLASSEPTMTPEEEKEYYLQRGLRTKQMLLDEILASKDRFKNPREKVKKKSDAYYDRMMQLMDRFYREVASMYLMEELNDFWGYGFIVRETGITLFLEHLMMMYDEGISFDDKWETSRYLVPDEEFAIHQTKAKLLTLEEYGTANGVAADTVRQWIRRGKIRSAVKYGTEWRIPELAEVIGRKYYNGHYEWSSEIPDPPEEIPNINDFDDLNIYPAKETGIWTVMLHNAIKGENSGLAMTTKMKEKLEVFLISHPLVECVNNFIGEVHQKGGIDYEFK